MATDSKGIKELMLWSKQIEHSKLTVYMPCHAADSSTDITGQKTDSPALECIPVTPWCALCSASNTSPLNAAGMTSLSL